MLMAKVSYRILCLYMLLDIHRVCIRIFWRSPLDIEWIFECSRLHVLRGAPILCDLLWPFPVPYNPIMATYYLSWHCSIMPLSGKPFRIRADRKCQKTRALLPGVPADWRPREAATKGPETRDHTFTVRKMFRVLSYWLFFWDDLASATCVGSG